MKKKTRAAKRSGSSASSSPFYSMIHTVDEYSTVAQALFGVSPLKNLGRSEYSRTIQKEGEVNSQKTTNDLKEKISKGSLHLAKFTGPIGTFFSNQLGIDLKAINRMAVKVSGSSLVSAPSGSLGIGFKSTPAIRTGQQFGIMPSTSGIRLKLDPLPKDIEEAFIRNLMSELQKLESHLTSLLDPFNPGDSGEGYSFA